MEFDPVKGVDWESSINEESIIFSKDDISEMIEVAVKTAMTAFQELLMSKMNEKICSVSSMVTHVEDQIRCVEVKLGALESENAILKNNISDMQHKLENAEDMVIKAWHHANATEQYTRKNNIRINGLQLDRNSPCAEQVAMWMSSRLRVQTTVADIEAAHVLPQSPAERASGKPPTIIVKFVRRDLRDRVVKARSALRGTRFVINDDVTKLNYKLLQRVRNQHPELSAWYYNGKCFIKRGNTVKKIQPFDNIDDVFSSLNESTQL